MDCNYIISHMMICKDPFSVTIYCGFNELIVGLIGIRLQISKILESEIGQSADTSYNT